MRPFGAIVFGRLGDIVGRKYTFLITIVIMGLSTAIVGILPGYATIGVAAPIILVSLRLLQGLALGGEYGGAAVYVAEHAPDGKRGLYTSWIQTTATLGLFLSLVVILVCRATLGDAFETWGWRIPFLLSIVLLAVSVYIRLQLDESPVFRAMKAEGTHSRAPLTESFARWGNLKIVLLALFGATAGQAVVWYTGQFYALFFLTQTLKVEPLSANLLIAAALVIGTPFFLVFGALSDRIGRKIVIMAGCLLAVVLYFPVFKAITHYANPALESASRATPVTVIAAPGSCSFQFDPLGRARFVNSCDIARAALARAGVPYCKQRVAGRRHCARPRRRRRNRRFRGRRSRYRSAQGRERGVLGGARCRARERRLSGARRPRPDRLSDGARATHAARAARHHGLRSDRRLAGGTLPRADPLHLDVTALPHRQRLVRWLPANGVLRAGRDDRRHLLRPLVPGCRSRR